MAEPAEVAKDDAVTERKPPDSGPASYFRRHPHAKWILLAVLIAVGVAAYFVWSYYSIRESTDDAQINGDIYQISARVGGHVIAVDVENNQLVKKGDILVRLDPTDFQVALEHAQANYANAVARASAAHAGVPITSIGAASNVSVAQAGVDAAKAAVASARRQYQAAQAKVKQAQAAAAQVESNLKRYSTLIQKDEISQQQYENTQQLAQADAAAVAAAQAAAMSAHQSVAQAQAGVAQAQANLQAAKAGPQRIRASRAQAGAAEAAVKVAKAGLDQAKLNLSYVIIRAPADGVVGRKSVESGENIQKGQALMAVVPVTGLYVTANFKESQLANMRPGDPATIHVDAYDRDYKGHVLSIAGATGEKFSLLPPENATGNYVKVVQRIPVKIVFEPGEDKKHLLRIGMSVEPTVITSH